MKCDKAPYLYVTTHTTHAHAYILKYSRNGCLLSSNVIKGGPVKKGDMLRKMILGYSPHFNTNNTMFLAKSDAKYSEVLLYGDCDSSGTRAYLGTALSNQFNPGANHTYGLGKQRIGIYCTVFYYTLITFNTFQLSLYPALDSDNNIYASFQHTDVVLRYSGLTFEPVPIPKGV